MTRGRRFGARPESDFSTFARPTGDGSTSNPWPLLFGQGRPCSCAKLSLFLQYFSLLFAKNLPVIFCLFRPRNRRRPAFSASKAPPSPARRVRSRPTNASSFQWLMHFTLDRNTFSVILIFMNCFNSAGYRQVEKSPQPFLDKNNMFVLIKVARPRGQSPCNDPRKAARPLPPQSPLRPSGGASSRAWTTAVASEWSRRQPGVRSRMATILASGEKIVHAMR